MHASIACLLLYEDYVWVSLGNAMKAKQSKAHCFSECWATVTARGVTRAGPCVFLLISVVVSARVSRRLMCQWLFD
jgi:hypothetical protein